MSKSTAPVSRREEKRQDTIAEIKTRARQQLADRGAGGLSLRGVARDMRMSSAGIYRYFGNQADLIGALCVDAFLALGDEMETARDRHASEDPTVQWWATSHAVRHWSLHNPEDFALIFGTPIAGYHAPVSVTGPSSGRTMGIAMEIYLAALESGSADLSTCFLPDSTRPGKLGAYQLAALGADPLADPATDRYLQMSAVALNAWASILGFLTTELFGSLTRLVDNVDDLYCAHLRTLLLGMGFSREIIETHTMSQ